MTRLAALALLLTLAACGGGEVKEPAATVTVTQTPTGPKTFSASGYIDLEQHKFGGHKGDPCSGEEGYDDIQSGTQVTVSAKGDIIAVGRLDSGALTQGGYLGDCRFRFTVDDIPAGFALYSVEVSHRGALTYSEAEMADGLSFTLGG